jgi:hypothetical protein
VIFLFFLLANSWKVDSRKLILAALQEAKKYLVSELDCDAFERFVQSSFFTLLTQGVSFFYFLGDHLLPSNYLWKDLAIDLF